MAVTQYVYYNYLNLIEKKLNLKPKLANEILFL